MNPDSKIYIVVAVLAVILVGIFVYLFFYGQEGEQNRKRDFRR